ncbi:MAG: hypothetical protein VKS61_08830 [Candidatus Sericytochromatia bacterium]|nr:hypothetical protein [Candidatus Sericytochromatia bacterium]
MSDVSVTSIHRVGPYRPGRGSVTPPSPQWPVAPGPVAPPTPQWPAQPPAGWYPPAPVQPPVNTRPPFPGYPGTPTQPTYPAFPAYPGTPTQSPFPGAPAYPGRPGPGGSFLGEVWVGVKERSFELGQVLRHPFSPQLRQPYLGRNPWAPRTTGETVGRWLVNGTLIVGAVLGGRALIGAGGGAGVGARGGLLEVLAAPFRFLGRVGGAALNGLGEAVGFLGRGLVGAFGLVGRGLGALVSGLGNVVAGIGNFLGNILSAIFGGARVGLG